MYTHPARPRADRADREQRRQEHRALRIARRLRARDTPAAVLAASIQAGRTLPRTIADRELVA